MYWGKERLAFLTALRNPRLQSSQLDDVVRFIDDNQLLDGRLRRK